MKKAAVRFGIRDGEYRGATWKLWNEDDEVYFTGRSLGGSLKVSLHKSGRWHLAYTKQVYEDLIEGIVPSQEDRFIEKWDRPEPISQGVTLALRIITPSGSVNNPDQTQKTNIVWIPNSKPGEALEIYIVITSANCEFNESWPAKNSGSSLIGAIELLNGETVWAVYSAITAPNFEDIGGTPEFFPGRGESDVSNGKTRAFLFGENPDGSRVIADIAVIKKNDKPKL